MITNPVPLQKLTNDCICFHCEKKIDMNGPLYEICLKSDILKTASSEEITSKYNKDCGYGSILRFHISCWEEIAGEEYIFDQNVWK